jgi:hypothetical protein
VQEEKHSLYQLQFEHSLYRLQFEYSLYRLQFEHSSAGEVQEKKEKHSHRLQFEHSFAGDASQVEDCPQYVQLTRYGSVEEHSGRFHREVVVEKLQLAVLVSKCLRTRVTDIPGGSYNRRKLSQHDYG